MKIYKIWKPDGNVFGYLFIAQNMWLITEEPLEMEQYFHIILPEERNSFMKTKNASKFKNGYFITIVNDDFLVKLKNKNYSITEPTKNEMQKFFRKETNASKEARDIDVTSLSPFPVPL